MAIPDKLIMDQLGYMLTSSEPGDQMHRLHLVTAPIGPLGLVDEEKADLFVYAIATTEDVDSERFIHATILQAFAERQACGDAPLFAALSQEMYLVTTPNPETVRGSLADHPDSVEVTLVYGAAADGRRWRGRRFLTGPQAGEGGDVEELTEDPERGEERGVSAGPLLRRLVGQGIAGRPA